MTTKTKDKCKECKKYRKLDRMYCDNCHNKLWILDTGLIIKTCGGNEHQGYH